MKSRCPNVCRGTTPSHAWYLPAASWSITQLMSAINILNSPQPILIVIINFSVRDVEFQTAYYYICTTAIRKFERDEKYHPPFSPSPPTSHPLHTRETLSYIIYR